MTAESKPVRIGVIGVGFGATVHIPGLQSEGVDVVAVCARRQERAEDAATRFGVPRVYTDYEELLRQPDIDAVAIVTPVALHHEMTLAALRAGKHVLCEKPFALNTVQAREMVDAAQSTGLTTMIAHEFRFASGRMRAKELIDEGYVGDLRLVLLRLLLGGMGPAAARPAPDAPPPAYVAGRDSAAQGAGMLFGLGSHFIDGLRHWFGEVESVSAELTTFAPDRTSEGGIVKADADDTFQFTLHFASGGIAEMIASRSAPFGSAGSVEVYGSKGTLVMPQRGPNPPAHGVLLAARVGEEKLTEQTIPERLQPFADVRDDRLMPFRLEVREFVRGIREGTSPAPNFVDGLRCQQVLDAVRESAATGRRVYIEAE